MSGACEHGVFSPHVCEICAAVLPLREQLAAANSRIDQLDCTQREGGITKHYRVESPCLRCQLDAANKRANEARAVAIESAARAAETSESVNWAWKDAEKMAAERIRALEPLPPSHRVVPVSLSDDECREIAVVARVWPRDDIANTPKAFFAAIRNYHAAMISTMTKDAKNG